MQVVVEITDDRCQVDYESPIHTTHRIICELSDLGDLLKQIFNRKSADEKI